MADINIQPKKPSRWSYILYGIALAAIIFLVFRSVNDSDKPVETQTVTVDTGMVSGSVNAFISYIRDNNNSEETGTSGDAQSSPEYASYGFHLLAAAIGATVARDDPNDPTMKQKSVQLQEMADSIRNNWDAYAKSGSIKTAFISAVDLFNELQSKHYPDLRENVQQVQKAAEALDPEQKAIEQSDIVKDFFEQSGQILQAMTPKKQSAGLL